MYVILYYFCLLHTIYDITCIYFQKPMLKMAKLLKTSMKNESKTATEIIKILQSQQSNVENKDKMCEIIYNELLDHKILIKDSTMTDTEKYKIDHIKYNKIMDKSLSEAQAIPQPISQAQQSCVGSWGGGTPVTVFSPKSRVWRDGLVLNFDPKTSIGRVCSYNNMGKQSIKELTLPNDYVRPKFDFPPSIPMTAEAWNSTFVNQDS